MPVSFLITAGLCALLAAVLVARRSTRRSPARAASEPRQPRHRPRLGLTVSGLASQEALVEAAARQAVDPAVVEAGPDGAREHPARMADATPDARIPVPEVIDAPGWPQPGELDRLADRPDSDSGADSAASASAGERGEQCDRDDAWTAVADGFDPTTGWDHGGASRWTAPDAPPADWSSPAPTETLHATAIATGQPEAAWDAVVADTRADAGVVAWRPFSGNSPTAGWDDGIVLDADGPVLDADGPVLDVDGPALDTPARWTPEAVTIEPGVAEPERTTWSVPAPPENAYVVDLSGGAGVEARMLTMEELPRLLPDDAELLAPVGHAVASPGPLVVVIAPIGERTPSPREERLARAIRRLEAKVASMMRETGTSTPSRARRASEARPGLRLSALEERELRALAARRSAPPRLRRRARIVLATARGLDVGTIARRVGVHRTTVRRWQRRFAEQRLAAITVPPRASSSRRAPR